MVQRPAQKGLQMLAFALADAAHHRFGDAADSTRCLHQGTTMDKEGPWTVFGLAVDLRTSESMHIGSPRWASFRCFSEHE